MHNEWTQPDVFVTRRILVFVYGKIKDSICFQLTSTEEKLHAVDSHGTVYNTRFQNFVSLLYNWNNLAKHSMLYTEIFSNT